MVKAFNSLERLEALRIKREERRIAEAQEKASREYKNDDWFNLIESKDFKKLEVPALNKYLVKQSVKDHMELRKSEKLQFIEDHIFKKET